MLPAPFPSFSDLFIGGDLGLHPLRWNVWPHLSLAVDVSQLPPTIASGQVEHDHVSNYFPARPFHNSLPVLPENATVPTKKLLTAAEFF